MGLQKVKLVFLIVLINISYSTVNGGENRLWEGQALPKKKLEILKEKQSLLNETRKQKYTQLQKISRLESNISGRRSLIQDIEGEIHLVSTEIDEKEDEFLVLKEEHKGISSNLSSLLIEDYKCARSLNKITYLLSSESLYQATKRLMYLSKIAEYRHKQATLLYDKLIQNTEELKELRNLRSEQLVLVNLKIKEESKLNQDIETSKNLISSLEGKELTLKKEIKRKAKLSKQLNQAVVNTISIQSDPVESKSEEYLKADGFASRKGTLPWPTAGGFISVYFGKHKHPTLKGISKINNGVNIRVGSNKVVRSVYKGTVAAVVSIPGMNYSVIVKHGDYFTVYSNVSDVMVSNGEAIESNQAIGKVADLDGNSELHFEVWKGNTKLNPSKWIRRK